MTAFGGRSPSFIARRTETSGAGGVLTSERTIASRLVAEALPTFDLILATVDRVEELERLFDSLERQTHTAFRLIVVDQNEDDRVAEALARSRVRGRAPALRARALAGPQRGAPAREADVVAFPDDDCVYLDGLLEHSRAPVVSDPDARRVGRAGGRPGRAAVRRVEDRRCRARRTTTSGTERTRSRSSCAASRSRRSASSTSSSGSGRGSRGRRARRSSSSCAQFAAARGSRTTRASR